MADFYELSEFQLDTLKRLAKDPQELLVVIETVEGDQPDTIEKFAVRKSEADELVVLGLLEDRTKSMVDAVVGFKLRTGRNPHMYYATDFGRIMFEKNHKKNPN